MNSGDTTVVNSAGKVTSIPSLPYDNLISMFLTPIFYLVLISASHKCAASTRSGMVTLSLIVCIPWSAIPTTTELIPLSLKTFPSVPPPEGFIIGSSPRVDNADITLDVAGSSEVRV